MQMPIVGTSTGLPWLKRCVEDFRDIRTCDEDFLPARRVSEEAYNYHSHGLINLGDKSLE